MPGAEHQHLRKLRRVYEHGVWLGPRPSLLEQVIAHLGLEKANAVSTPMTTDDKSDDKTPLEEESAGTYRSCVGCLLYVAHDRADIAYPVKERARHLAAPSEPDMIALRRLVRYMIGTKDLGLWMPRGVELNELVVTTDSDWARCKETRRSTTGVVLEAA